MNNNLKTASYSVHVSIKLVDANSKLFHDVCELGDANRSTLGFLPAQAFYQYAERKGIFAATDKGKLLGYVMFRKRHNGIVIVHLCIDPQYRGKDIANILVQHIDDLFPDISYISLYCRRDYGLDNFWRKLGFTPISEKKGRAYDESILTRWQRTKKSFDLLHMLDEHDRQDKVVAAVDTNIVIDLYEGKNEESIALFAMHMSEASYRITNDVFNEINRNKNNIQRTDLQKFVQSRFMIIEENHSPGYLDLINEISRDIDMESHHFDDISHITQCILSNTMVFITRDEWLRSRNEYFYIHYGISIRYPAEFICDIEELAQGYLYSPASLAGSELVYNTLATEDIDNIIRMLCNTVTFSGKNKTRKNLRNYIACRDKYDSIVVKHNAKSVAAYVITKNVDPRIIECFVIDEKYKSSQWQNTLARHLVMRLIKQACAENRNIIIFNKNLVTMPMLFAFRDYGFIESDGICAKLSIKGCLSRCEVEKKVFELIAELSDMFVSDSAKKKLIETIEQTDNIELERILWPVKIAEANINCYIVPIQPDYAMQLFDEQLMQTYPMLFPLERTEAALSVENVYFRSPKPSICKAPARIMWYISNDKFNRVSGVSSVRAVSYLIDSTVGSANELYRKHQRFGVLAWSKVMKITRNDPNGDVSAMIFGLTEQFTSPLPYASIVDIIERKTGKRPTFQSPYQIDQKVFNEIYNRLTGVPIDGK